MEFKFTDKINDVNWDSDLFYDMTDGGYLDPEELLEDKELAHEIKKASLLLYFFFEAIRDHFDE